LEKPYLSGESDFFLQKLIEIVYFERKLHSYEMGMITLRIGMKHCVELRHVKFWRGGSYILYRWIGLKASCLLGSGIGRQMEMSLRRQVV
jgi:hypothetical protein